MTTTRWLDTAIPVELFISGREVFLLIHFENLMKLALPMLMGSQIIDKFELVTDINVLENKDLVITIGDTQAILNRIQQKHKEHSDQIQ